MTSGRHDVRDVRKARTARARQTERGPFAVYSHRARQGFPVNQSADMGNRAIWSSS